MIQPNKSQLIQRKADIVLTSSTALPALFCFKHNDFKDSFSAIVIA